MVPAARMQVKAERSGLSPVMPKNEEVRQGAAA